MAFCEVFKAFFLFFHFYYTICPRSETARFESRGLWLSVRLNGRQYTQVPQMRFPLLQEQSAMVVSLFVRRSNGHGEPGRGCPA